MKRVLFFVIAISYYTASNAQINDWGVSKINNIIPPSPEAANFARYVEIPVGNYTGTPNISLPIWNVKQGSLEVPITLSYHSLGIKVEEFAPWVGLGWTLNAGGIVTRTVRGLPDDIHLGTNYSTFTKQYNYEYLTGPASGDSDPRSNPLGLLVQNCADAEPDIFYFNFGNYTGKIMYDWGGQPVVSCSKSVKVKDIRGYSNGPDKIIGWDITTGEGTIYKFRDIEQTNSGSNYGISCIGEMPIVNSSWLLTEITDANNENKIFFEYEGYILTLNINNSSSITYYNYPIQGSGSIQYNSSVTAYYGKRIKRIKTSSTEETIDFIPGAERIDLNGLYNPNNRGDNDNLKSLSQINIKSNENLVKSYALSFDYSVNRLTLKSITEKSPNGTALPPQSFSYYQGELPSLNSNSQDHWGFFNGVINPNLIPSAWVNLPNPAFHVGANRSTNSISTKIGLIKKIEYPTGGHVEFDYEQNEYGFVQNEPLESKCVINSSLVVTDLFSKPTSNAILTKPFTINSALCNGEIKNVPTIVTINYQGYNYDQFASNKPKVELVRSDGTTVFFHEFGVTGTEQAEIGSIILTLTSGNYTMKAFGFYPSPTNPNNVPGNYAGIHVEYLQPNSIKKNDVTGGMRIKSIKEFTNYGDIPRVRIFSYKMLNDTTKSSGVIYQIPYYQYSGDKVFRKEDIFNMGTSTCTPFPVSYEMRMSANPNILGSTQGSHIGYRHVKVTLSGGEQFSGQTEFRYTSPFDYPDLISVSPPFAPPVGKSYATGLLKEQSDYLYNGLERQILVKIENDYHLKNYEIKALKMGSMGVNNCFLSSRWMSYYLYGQYINNIGHIQLKSSIRTAYSNGITPNFLTINEEYLYDPNFQRLKRKIEKTSTLKNIISDFYYPDEILNRSTIQVAMVNKFIVDHPIEVVKSIDFGSGNIRITNATYYQFRNETGGVPRLDKIYSYKTVNPLSSSFPLSVNNAEGQKNSLYDPIEDLHFQIYSQAGMLLQTKSKDFLTSYLYGYKGQYPVGKILNTTYDVAKTYISQAILDKPTNDIEMRNHLSSLRTIPNALVTTYTYKPLVGITSETDPNGRTTFYEYDSFNRLMHLKDQNGNIIKKYCYNYAGQTINCNGQTFTNTQAYSGQFQKTGCTTGFVGSTVTYTVPIGTVTSIVSAADANTLAQAKVNAEGQAYANSNGTCIPSAPPGPCTLTVFSPIYFPTYSLYSSGTQTTGYIVVWFPNGITMGSNIPIGAFGSGSCRPTVDRYQTVESGGRTYAVTYSASGVISVRLIAGGNLAPSSTISISINFNL